MHHHQQPYRTSPPAETMLDTALSALLASVAGHYARLSPSDVGIGLNGGRLTVEDVELRPESLASPALPFRIIKGRAGALRINVPWAALSSAPIVVRLENVELVAAPCSSELLLSTKPPPLPSAQRWHETRLGRVLYNVQLEIDGLRLEYRDGECVARVDAQELRVNSADEDFNPTFVPIDGVGTGAVAMRKVFVLSGGRCVMVAATREEQFGFAKPVLKDIDVTVKAFVCAGEGTDDDMDGVHADVDVELDEPAVNLSKTQLDWIQHIFNGASRPASMPPTPRRHSRLRSHSSTPNGTQAHDDVDETFETSDTSSPLRSVSALQNGSVQSYDDKLVESDNSSSQINLLSDDHDDRSEASSTTTPQPQVNRSGGLRSLWNAIVAENFDDTADDAAFVLGLRSASIEKRNAAEYRQRLSLTGSRRIAFDSDDEDEDVVVRKAVSSAAAAGGWTVRVRLRTPDGEARAKVKELEEALLGERMMRTGLEDAESALLEASERVKRAEEKAYVLGEKNKRLKKELSELEELTAKAGRNKDAIIRQMEAALTKAERNLEDLLREKTENLGSEEIKEWRRRQRSSDTFVVVGGSSEDGADRTDEDDEMHRDGEDELQSSREASPQASDESEADKDMDGGVEMYRKEAGAGEIRTKTEEETELRERLERHFSPRTRPKSIGADYADDGLTLI